MDSKLNRNPLALFAVVMASGVLGYLTPFFIGLETYGYVRDEKAEELALRGKVVGMMTFILQDEQRLHAGEKTPEGCFILENVLEMQKIIFELEITAEELDQSEENMLCYGHLRPANFKLGDGA